MNTQRYKDMLLKEKSNITQLVSKMKDNTVFGNTSNHTSEKYTTSELSSYDNHPGDLGTEVFMQEMQNSLTDHERMKINDINDALNRIENGSYGICEHCKKNIDEERLDFIPETNLCSCCAKEIDGPINQVESVSIKDNFSGPNLFTTVVEELVDINRNNKE
ncbi:MAG: TraR/DksA C4-type zinc finger protein [Paraclostridium sp.]